MKKDPEDKAIPQGLPLFQTLKSSTATTALHRHHLRHHRSHRQTRHLHLSRYRRHHGRPYRRRVHPFRHPYHPYHPYRRGRPWNPSQHSYQKRRRGFPFHGSDCPYSCLSGHPCDRFGCPYGYLFGCRCATNCPHGTGFRIGLTPNSNWSPVQLHLPQSSTAAQSSEKSAIAKTTYHILFLDLISLFLSLVVVGPIVPLR